MRTDSYAFCVSKVVDLIEATNDFTLLDEIELRLGLGGPIDSNSAI